MHYIKRNTLILLLSLTFCTLVQAEGTNTTKKSAITCEKFDYDIEENVAYLRGKVRVKFDGYQLKADEAVIYMKSNKEDKVTKDTKAKKEDKVAKDAKAKKEDKSESRISGFSKIVATGNVLITSDERTITAQKAVWDNKTSKITFTGGPPIAKQGLSYIKSTRIVVDILSQDIRFFPEPEVVFNMTKSEEKRFEL